MCYISHSGVLFSNSLPLIPRNMSNEAFSREVEMLPETCHQDRTCCWFMLWVVLGIWGLNWLELLLTPKIKSKAFLSSSDKVPPCIWLPAELCPTVEVLVLSLLLLRVSVGMAAHFGWNSWTLAYKTQRAQVVREGSLLLQELPFPHQVDLHQAIAWIRSWSSLS